MGARRGGQTSPGITSAGRIRALQSAPGALPAGDRNRCCRRRLSSERLELEQKRVGSISPAWTRRQAETKLKRALQSQSCAAKSRQPTPIGTIPRSFREGEPLERMMVSERSRPSARALPDGRLSPTVALRLPAASSASVTVGRMSLDGG